MVAVGAERTVMRLWGCCRRCKVEDVGSTIFTEVSERDAWKCCYDAGCDMAVSVSAEEGEGSR